ncbi:hypothetical protein D3C73_1047590 [compost metagenome]
MQQALLRTLLVDLVVAGGHRFLHFEGLVQFLVIVDAHTDQLGVGRPDHGSVHGVHRGQQKVWQVFDMIKKLDARSGTGARVDVRIGGVSARVEHFAHGAVRRNRGMANFGGAHGLHELRGQHGVALDTLLDHETRGNVAQAQCHAGNDEKTRHGKPAHQIERRPPILGLCCRRIRR